ncbi:MAG: PD-(D/E)XK nuclease family protein [Candidatus Methanomethylicaceae archaeon]
MVSPLRLRQEEAALLPNAIEITHSDIVKFLTCRQLFQYGSTLGRNLMPKKRAVYFAFGTLLHQALEQYYLGHESPEDFYVQEARKILAQVEEAGIDHLEDLLDELVLGPFLIRAYRDWDRMHNDFEVVSTEKRITYRLTDKTPGVFVSMRYDMLVHRESDHKPNRYWIVDFKTAKRMPNDSELEVWGYLDQSLLYQAVAERVFAEQGIEIAGISFIHIWKRMPTAPEMTTTGLTRRSSLVTTAERYLEAIVEHGLDPKDYEDVLDSIRKSYNGKWFMRNDFVASHEQRELYLERLKNIVSDMLDPELKIYPSPRVQNCTYCDFKEPCMTRQVGANDEPILASLFVESPERD